MKSIGVKNNLNLMQLLLVPTCVALSVVGYQLSQILKLPLFLDIAGLALSGILGGPWIALLTAVLNHIVNGMIFPTVLPFMPVSIAIGVAIGIFAKFNFFKIKGKSTGIMIIEVIIKCFILVAVMTALGIVAATPVTILLFGGVTGSTTDILTAIYLQSTENLIDSVLKQTFWTGLVNNTINLVIAWYLISKISDRFLTKTNYGINVVRKVRKVYNLDGEKISIDEVRKYD